MMPARAAVFTDYVMVDWSGADGRRSGRADCIWIAYGARDDRRPATVSPPSRTEAEQIIRSLVAPVAVSPARRALIGCDFGYGYPEGFAALLLGPSGAREVAAAPWRAVWQYLAAHVRDDIPHDVSKDAGAGRPTNRSNRFDVANAINEAVSSAAARGPFWCLCRPGSHPAIPQRQPRGFVAGGVGIRPLRLTDVRAGSDTCFRLFGTGSVGSQILTGIPRLQRLCFDPALAAVSAVWPFETGWGGRARAWPGRGVRIVHAEVYPSVRAPRRDAIKDRGQVRALWHWARDRDAQGRLAGEFAIPPGIQPGSRDDDVIRREEGWILGCPLERQARP